MNLDFFKRYVIAPIDVLLEKLVNAPVVFISLLMISLHPSWQAFILLLISILATAIWDVYVTYTYNCVQYKNILNYLQCYEHCTMHCFKLKNVIHDIYKIKSPFDIFNTEMRSVAFNNQIRNCELDHLCVLRRNKVGERYPSVPTAFFLVDNPSYIFVTDLPDPENLMQVFYIYHEVGHLSGNQETIRNMYRRNKIRAINFLLAASILTHFNIVIILITVIGMMYWILSGKIVSSWRGRLELDADSFAVFALVNHPSFEKMIHLAKKIRSNEAKRPVDVTKLPFWERIVELARTKNGRDENATHEAVRWLERAAEWAKNEVTLMKDPTLNSFFNYNASTERLRITPLSIRILVACTICTTSIMSKIPQVSHLLVFAAILVIFPIYIIRKIKRDEGSLRYSVESILGTNLQQEVQALSYESI